MFRLIETIRLNEGEFSNLAYHEDRMYRCMKQVFGVDRKVNLKEVLGQYAKPATGLHRCRLIYDNKMRQAEFIPYTFRPVRSLKIVHGDALSYDHKFEDRKEIDDCFKKRVTCDDVLIVKQGKITDTSVANIALRRGSSWVTPVSCLLPGTMRQNLLDHKKLTVEEIALSDLSQFEAFKVVNAMLQFDAPESLIENIFS